MDGWNPHYDLVMGEPTPSNLVLLKSSFNLVTYSLLIPLPQPTTYHLPLTFSLLKPPINSPTLLILSTPSQDQLLGSYSSFHCHAGALNAIC